MNKLKKLISERNKIIIDILWIISIVTALTLQQCRMGNLETQLKEHKQHENH